MEFSWNDSTSFLVNTFLFILTWQLRPCPHLEQDVMSDCLSMQHLQSSSSSQHLYNGKDGRSPGLGQDIFTGAHRPLLCHLTPWLCNLFPLSNLILLSATATQALSFSVLLIFQFSTEIIVRDTFATLNNNRKTNQSGNYMNHFYYYQKASSTGSHWSCVSGAFPPPPVPHIFFFFYMLYYVVVVFCNIPSEEIQRLSTMQFRGILYHSTCCSTYVQFLETVIIWHFQEKHFSLHIQLSDV